MKKEKTEEEKQREERWKKKWAEFYTALDTAPWWVHFLFWFLLASFLLALGR